MKIAIVHDTLTELGGAERVLASLIKLFPDADVYTALAKKEILKKYQRLTNHKIIISPLSILPANESYASWLKPAIFLYWRLLNLSKYDLVISSSHSFNSKAVKTKETPHIAYIYTPPRYLYGEFNKTSLVTRSKISFLFSPLFFVMKLIDYRISQEPDRLIAISQVVKKRIKKYYGRDSIVIYPPLKPRLDLKKGVGKYYVCLSRLTEQKGISLAIKTCNKLKKKLLIIGTGPAEKKLKKMAGPTIKFLGFIDDDQISRIFQETQALLYPSIDEDFGLTPIEAMAHGVPVIAYASGATHEYIVPDKTGLLFKEHSVESLSKSILQFEKKSWSAKTCRQFSMKFTEDKFHQKILKEIKLLASE